MARITFSLPDELEPAITERVRDAEYPSVSAYVCDLLRRDLTKAGLLQADPMSSVRNEALAAAEIAGANQVLTALRVVRETAIQAKAAATLAG